MAKLPGLFQRGGVWTLRVMIPQDLKPLYGGRSKLVLSLGTTNHDTAKVAGTARRAILLSEFADKRRELNPHKVDAVSPELGKVLAQRVARAVLSADDNARSRPEAARLLLGALRQVRASSSKLRIGATPAESLPSLSAAPADLLEGLSPELVAELADVNAAQNANAAQQMAMQRIAAVLPLVKAEARALGLDFDERTPGAFDALRECLKAFRRAWQDVSKRDEGEVVETPEAVTRVDAIQAMPTKLRDVLPQWKASKARKVQTEQAAEKALGQYEEATGNPPIGTLTRSQGVDFRAWLLSSGISTKTAHDRFNYVKGLLNFAARELELIQRNPWAGLAIEYTTQKPRRPWSTEQLQSLLSRPLFTAYEIPSAWDAGADAAYWVPLLGAFTGARIGELCQLKTADVQTVDGVAVLQITDQAEGQSVNVNAEVNLTHFALGSPK